VIPVQAPIVGREAELAVVRRFVAEHANGPASLAIVGGAGIGKTTLWTQALLAAHAARAGLLTCRCDQSNATWSFAGLGDLFDGLGPSELEALGGV